MRKQRIKTLCLLLCVCLQLTSMFTPTVVFADDGDASLTIINETAPDRGTNPQIGDSLILQVKENFQNISSSAIDTVNVSCSGLSIILTETTTDSAVFEANVTLTDGATDLSLSPARIHAELNQTIDFTYQVIGGGTVSQSVTIADGGNANTLPKLQSVTANQGGGAVPSGTAISLFSTPGAIIYFTMDGTEPTTGSSIYNEGNKPKTSDSGNTTIKAIAVMEGYFNSDTAVFSFSQLLPTNPSGGGTGDTGGTGGIGGGDSGGEPPSGNNSGPSVGIYTLGSIPQYAIGDTVNIWVVDYDSNESIVTASALISELGIVIQLNVNPNVQGNYYGKVKLVSGPSNASASIPELHVTAGDNVSFKYSSVKNGEKLTQIGVSNSRVANVNCSPAAVGTVPDGTQVTLKCDTADATIYYTTNGSEPNKSSNLYSDSNKPSINGPTTIKAVAFKDGFAASNILTFTYNFIKNVDPVFMHDEQIRVKMRGISQYNNNVQGVFQARITGSSLNMILDDVHLENQNNDEADVCFNVPGGLNAGYGKYDLIVYNKATNSIIAQDYLTVAARLSIKPAAIPFEEYKIAGTSLAIDSGDYDGTTKLFNWNESTPLSIEIHNVDNNFSLEYSDLNLPFSMNPDNTIYIAKIGATETAIAGVRDIRVYDSNTRILLAKGNFFVGEPKVDGVMPVEQGGNKIIVTGSNLNGFTTDKLRLEVYNDLNQKVLESTDYDFMWGYLNFRTKIQYYDTARVYGIKLFDETGHEYSITDRIINVIAPLSCSPHCITTNNTNDAVTVNNNGLWSTADKDKMSVEVRQAYNLSNPEYTATVSNGGLVVSDQTITMKVSKDGGITRAFKSGNNKYILYVKKDSKVIGYTYFVVGTDQVSGTIYNHDNSPATGGWVIVSKENDNNFYLETQVMPDGKFYISSQDVIKPALDDGKYYFKVIPVPGSESFDYRGEFTVNSGVASPNIINVTLPGMQFDGTVAASGVSYEDVEVDVCSDDNFDQTFPVNSEGKFSIGGLPNNKTYMVFAYSKSNTNLISNAVKVDIDGSGKSSLTTINLQLVDTPVTQINVKNLSNAAIAADKYDVILRPINGSYSDQPFYISNRQDGISRIAKLPAGSYVVKVIPINNSQFAPSQEQRLDIKTDGSSSPASLNFAIDDSKQPYVVDVQNVCKYDGWYKVLIQNQSAVNSQWQNIKIEIYDNTGKKVLTFDGDNCETEAFFDDKDQCLFDAKPGNGIQLPFGKYTMKVFFNDKELTYLKGQDFWVVAREKTSPNFIEPQNYPGSTITVQNANGAWKAGDTVNIKISADKSDKVLEYKDLAITKVGPITITIPADANNVGGKRYIDISKKTDNGYEPIAASEFIVGKTQVKEVAYDEGENEVGIFGDYLEKYISDNTYLELYENGKLAATSTKYDNRWGNLYFDFNRYKLDLSKTYTIKLYSNGQLQDISHNTCHITPILIGSPKIIIGQTSGETITFYDYNNLWKATDDVDIQVNGDNINYLLTSQSGITITEDTISISTKSFNDNKQLKGDYRFTFSNITNGDIRIGYSVVYAGAQTDYLRGTLNTSAGKPSNGGKIQLNKENDDNWGYTATVGRDGSFIVPMNSLQGTGTYILKAIPPVGSSDAISITKFTRNNDTTPPPPQGLTIKLDATQLTGSILAGGKKAAFGNIVVFDSDWNKIKDIDAEADGTFRIGGLTEGAIYNMWADPDWKTSEYVSSYSKQVKVIFGTSVSFNLNQPQITGAALNVAGQPLYDYEYEVRVRPLTNECNGSWGAKNGRYLLGNLEPGKYAVSIIPKGDSKETMSFERIVTVDSNGNASPSSVDLRFTLPSVRGTVYNDGGAATGDLQVVVCDSYNYTKRIATFKVDSYGVFRIGGLPSGKYYIQAKPYYGSYESKQYDDSDFTEVKIDTSTVTAVDLVLSPKGTAKVNEISIPRIGEDGIYFGISGFAAITDLKKLSVEVLNVSGGQLTPAVIITGSSINLQSGIYEGETWLKASIPGGLKINIGDYQLRVSYDGVPLGFAWPDGDAFKAAYKVETRPGGVIPNEASGKVLKLEYNKGPQGNLPSPWSKSDTLTVKMYAKDTLILNAPYHVNTDNTISITLPNAASLPGGVWSEGDYRIEVCSGSSVLACNNLKVAVPTIKRIPNISDEDGRVRVEGDHLEAYTEDIGEIYDQSNKLIYSGPIWNFWGTLNIGADYLRFNLGSQYTVKIKHNNNYIALPNDGVFKIVPQLYQSPAVTMYPANGEKIVFVYPKGTKIIWSNLNCAIINSKDNNFSSKITSGLTVLGSSVELSLPDGLNPGRYDLVLLDSADNILGYSKFDLIDSKEIQGLVFVNDSSNKVVPFAGVCVENENEKLSFTADMNGHATIFGLKPGNYRMFAYADKLAVKYISSSEIGFTINSDYSSNLAAEQVFTLSPASIISGTISLPNGEVVTDGDIKLFVFALSHNGTDKEDDDVYLQNEIFIPKGQNSASYSIAIPKESSRNYVIGIGTWSTEGEYIGENYYSLSGTVYSKTSATTFSAISDVSGKNITINKGYIITGAVKLPQGITNKSSESIYVDVSAFDDKGTEIKLDDTSGSSHVKIPSNSSTGTYKISLPVGSYTLRYDVRDKIGGVAPEGFYNTAGTVYDQNKATKINVTSLTGSEQIDINVGGTIKVTGSISLPNGVNASVGGLTVTAFALSDNGTPDDKNDDSWISNQYVIPVNSNSVQYTLEIPKNGRSYVLGVGLWDKKPASYYSQYYYGSPAAVYSQAEATTISAISDISGKNIQISSVKVISGTIYLPKINTSAASVYVKVKALNDRGTQNPKDDIDGGCEVEIPNGSKQATFQFAVPDGNYTLCYQADAANGYYPEGHYSTTGMVFDKEKATKIAVASNTTVNLNVAAITNVSGTVSLPNGEVATDYDMKLFVFALSHNGTDNKDDDVYLQNEIFIPKGQNSASYSIAVPKESSRNYVIGIGTWSTEGKYIGENYYSDSGTVYSKTSATTFSAISDVSGKNIKINKGYIITGTVKLPQGITNKTSESIYVDVSAIDDKGTEIKLDDTSGSSHVGIPSNSSTGTYKISLPIGSYTLRYDVRDKIGGVAPEGFYNTAGTVFDPNKATKINVTSLTGSKQIDLNVGGVIKVTGLISLPNGVKATVGGLTVTAFALSDNGTFGNKEDDKWISNQFTIPEGSNSVEYTLELPKDSRSYVLGVGLWDIKPGLYSNQYYYGNPVSVYSQADATTISAISDISGKNIQIQSGKIISGTISLPESNTSTEPIYLEVIAINDRGTQDPRDDIDGGCKVGIPSGSNSAIFKFVVPNGTYTLRYQTVAANGYYPEGYYNDNFGTVYDGDSHATYLTVSNGAIQVNLSVAAITTVTGKINLPTGEKAPTGGLRVNVFAIDENGTYDTKKDDAYFQDIVTMSEGTDSVGYTIYLPKQTTRKYILGAGLWDKDVKPPLYLTESYYSNSGSTVYSHADATTFGAISDLTGKDITIAKGKQVSVTITLPSNVSGTELNVTVELIDGRGTATTNDDFYYVRDVKIPVGSKSVSYQFAAPAGSYILSYSIPDTNTGYMKKGFYSKNGTVFDKSQATNLIVSTVDLQANLPVAAIVKVSGKVNLPVAAPQGGMKVSVFALSENGTFDDRSDDQYYQTEVSIPEGKTSADYSFAIPKGSSSYILGVGVWESNTTGYVTENYLGNSGTVFSHAEATTFSAISDLTGKNIAIVKGKILSGTVSIPSTNTSTGAIIISVKAFDDRGTQAKPEDDIVKECDVSITNGAKSGTYQMVLPAGSYKLGYKVIAGNGYIPEGFYSTTGTVNNPNLAASINLTADVQANLSVSAITAPVVNKVNIAPNGEKVTINFNKPINAATVTANGFSINVSGSALTINSAQLDGSGETLTLNLKDYYIYSDYKNIKLSYNGNSIASIDNMKLAVFNMDIANTSSRSAIIRCAGEGSLIRGSMKFAAYCTGSAIMTLPSITIMDGNNTVGTSTTGRYETVFTDSKTYNLKVLFSDRKDSNNFTFTIDNIPPSIAIDGCANVENNVNGVIPVITLSKDSVSGSSIITLNGKTYDGTIAQKPDGSYAITGSDIKAPGSYTITASVKDTAGNLATDTKQFEIKWDMAAPTINISNIANGAICSNNIKPVINLTGGSNSARYSYTGKLKMPDGSVTTFSAVSIPSATEEGTYRLEVQAVNPSFTDVTSTKVVEFTVDKQNPKVDIQRLTDGTTFCTAFTPAIAFEDNVASQQLLTSNASITLTCSGAAVAYKLGDTISRDGVYTLSASTKDAAGHTSTVVTKTFTVDTTKPVIKFSGALDGYTYKDTNVTITAIALDNLTQNVTATVQSNGQNITLNGNHQYVFTGTAGQTVNYKLLITAQDAAGNITQQQVAFTIDRLPVNIAVSGISEGQIVNYNPDISFTTYSGDEEKTGTTATIDGAAFTGGTYSAEGAHTLVVKYISGTNTYTKTINFTIDKTKPVAAIVSVTHNSGTPKTKVVYAKVGDVIEVRANITDTNGIAEVSVDVGTSETGVPMKAVSGYNYNYEGVYTVKGGNYDGQNIIITAKDNAGNTLTQTFTNGYSLYIDNTKPSVSVVTNPNGPDGNNNIYKSASTSIDIIAGSTDAIIYIFNGVESGDTGSIRLTPKQGTNTLICYAIDKAGNKSDEKVLVMELDSVRPSHVSLDPIPAITRIETIKITGSVANEGGANSSVVIEKAGQIIAKTSVKADSTFEFTGIRLAEGANEFQLYAIDKAGNASFAKIDAVTRLDSTAPIISVVKDSDTSYQVNFSELVLSFSATFNEATVASSRITRVDDYTYNITVDGQIDGTNTMKVFATDAAGNTGNGVFTSTQIPANTAQQGVPLTDNATMDVPNTAFAVPVKMLVKTVDAQQNIDYKPIGAPIAFDFTNASGNPIEPSAPLVIRNYIGVGLTGIMLKHIDGTSITSISVETTTSGAFNMDNAAAIAAMPNPSAVYISDTGYLVLKTNDFSAYQVAQDNTAPVLTVSNTDYDINYNDSLALKLTGTISDNDPNRHISEVTVDGTPITLTGTTGSAFSINLSLTNGTHDVVITAADAAGNTSSVSKTFRVDKTAPALTASCSVILTNKNIADINITINENSQININNITKGWFNVSTVIPVNLNEGTNTINVEAVDAFENKTTAGAITITKDSVAPIITITGVNDGDIYGAAVTIAVSTGDSVSRTITMDGADYTPGAYNVQGQHTLAVIATDNAGNVANKSITFTIDTSVPTVTVSGAAVGMLYTDSRSISISANNADEITVTKSVDGAAAVSVATATAVTANIDLSVPDGQQHSYVIKVTAKKNNPVRTASTTLNFGIDKKNPGLTSSTPTQTEQTSIDITASVDETSDIYVNNGLFAQSISGAFTISGYPLVLGSNTVTIRAIDLAGHSSQIIVTVTRVTPPEPQKGGDTGSGNGGAGGFIPSFLQNQTAEEPTAQAGTIQPKPVLSGSEAIASITVADFESALKSAQKDENGVKTVTIDVKKVEGATEYTQIIPSAAMKANDAKQLIEISTPNGEITLPGNMFTAKDIAKSDNIAVSIALADKSKLSKALRKEIGDRPVIDLSVSKDGKEFAWSNPNAPVAVSFSYTPSAKELEKPDNIVIYYIDAKGAVQVVPNAKYDVKTGKVTFTTTHFSKYAVTFVNKTFKDIASSPKKAMIEAIAARGIMNGIGNDKFNPYGKLTRAQFMQGLIYALGLDTEITANFSDVKKTDYYYKAVGIAKKLGITLGAGNNMFKPNSLITNEEAVIFIYRAMKLANKQLTDGKSEDLAKFKDASKISKQAVVPYATLINEKVLNTSKDILDPKVIITRENFAELLYWVYKHN